MKHQISIVGKFLNEDKIPEIKKLAAEGEFELQIFKDRKEAEGKLSDTEIIFTDDVLMMAEAKEAVWCASVSSGVDHILKAGAIGANTVLTGGAGSYGITISEHVIGVIISLLRNFPEYAKRIERREWKGGLPVNSIYKSNILIMGTGDIGKTVATRLRGFQPEKIIGFNRSGRNTAEFDQICMSKDLDSKIKISDIIILALPATAETENIFDENRISMMKKSAIIVNVGRGQALDEEALADALNNHKIRGAAIDVTKIEPLPGDSKLWEAENLILTPHISGWMTLSHTKDKSTEMFCNNLKRYIKGQKLHGIIDIKRDTSRQQI